MLSFCPLTQAIQSPASVNARLLTWPAAVHALTGRISTEGTGLGVERDREGVMGGDRVYAGDGPFREPGLREGGLGLGRGEQRSYMRTWQSSPAISSIKAGGLPHVAIHPPLEDPDSAPAPHDNALKAP